MVDIGPVAWRNWRADPDGTVRAGVEVLLSSDAHIVGEVTSGLGPYRFLNALPAPTQHGAQPAIVVRAGYAIEFRPNLRGGEDKTDETRYHGGDMFDELAALLSLALGVRMRAAGRVRIWELADDEDDPLGHPVFFDVLAPYLPDSDAAIVPRLRRTVNVTDAVPLLQRYARVSATDAVAVLRAARLYQQAVWTADADPSSSWVQFVSALETAAGRARPAVGSPRERLRAGWPEVAAVLDAMPEQDTADAIAALVAPTVKATAAFLKFMEQFTPPPPESRPYEWAQVDWSALPQHLRTIYRYRSRALHAGTPFPLPMCEPARAFGDGTTIERPIGLSTWANDAVWNADDTPMLLSTFEYVARGALLAWWTQLPYG